MSDDERKKWADIMKAYHRQQTRYALAYLAFWALSCALFWALASSSTPTLPSNATAPH